MLARRRVPGARRRFSGITTGPTARCWRKRGQQGKDLVLDIDVQGARQLKEQIPEAVTVLFLRPRGRSWSSAFGRAVKTGTT